MSWVEKVNTRLIIKTGDGKEWSPEWLNADKTIDYNISEFNFPNVHGTLVDRREAKGAKYSLEIYFQGENHLEISDAFEISARDKRYWTVTHPMYGQLFVQPTSLRFDNSKYNVSKITGTIIETITENYPKPTTNAIDFIEENVNDLQEVTADNFENVVDVDAEVVALLDTSLEDSYTTYGPFIEGLQDGLEFIQKVNDARAKITNAVTQANQAMRAIQAVISAPALFLQDMKSKLSMLKENFDNLRATISGTIEFLSNPQKHIFEALAGCLVSSTAYALSKPQNEADFSDRTKVTDAIEFLLDMHSSYIADLDSLQSGNGTNPTDYVPDYETIMRLNEIVYFTLSNLYSIGLDAKQERLHLLEEDTDFINLTHRFYGLQPDDSTIEEMMRNNDFGLAGMLCIKKDTTIKYYI